MHSLNNKSIKVPTYAKIRTTRCIWFCTRLRVSPYDVELTQCDLITRLNEFGRVITKFPASISEFPRNPMPSQNVRLYLHMVGLGRVLRQRTFAFNGSHVGALCRAAMEQHQHQQTKKRMRGEFKNLRRARPDKNWITKRRRWGVFGCINGPLWYIWFFLFASFLCWTGTTAKDGHPFFAPRTLLFPALAIFCLYREEFTLFFNRSLAMGPSRAIALSVCLSTGNSSR